MLCYLSSGDFVEVDVSVARPHGRCTLEGPVEGTGFLPVGRVLANSVEGDAYVYLVENFETS